jgi:cholesterol oxidase
MVGCRYNAKNTLDKNYLYLAEQLGVTILPEQEVQNIRPLDDGGYQLTIRKSTGINRPIQKLQSKKVILSGGVMGTVKLLLKCRDNGSLNELSHKLGDFVRTNSEAILGVKLNKDPAEDFTKGISISAGFYPDENTHIETVRYGKGQSAMALMTTLLPDRKIPLPGFIRWGISIARSPLQFITNLVPINWARKTIILLVMQPVNNYLKLNYKPRWWRLGGKSMNSRSNTGEKIPSHISIGEKTAEMIIQKTGGTTITSYMDSIFGIPTTAHILGGAIMGIDSDSGVIDGNFEVFNYPGLYVVDGSSIPSNLGVNPSLTITAMAEYAMSRFSEA